MRNNRSRRRKIGAEGKDGDVDASRVMAKPAPNDAFLRLKLWKITKKANFPMKRTAKNKRTNEQNAIKRERNGGKVVRLTDELSRALRRSTATLALTCGVCVVASGCQSFLGADAERFRQGRGEYALNDPNVVRDWERAARETDEKRKISENEQIGKNERGERSGESASSDPAANQPILRSAAFDEGDERRVSALKPFLEEPEAPKTFGERVKGLFTFSKKESTSKKESKRPSYSESGVKSGKSANFTQPETTTKSARSNGSGFSWGRVLPTSMRRGREKFPVDPVLQYDESRFMPNFQTCEQYYSPLRPSAPSGYSLNGKESVKTAKSGQTEGSALSGAEPSFARSGAPRSTESRRAGSERVSGRDLVYGEAERRKTTTTETVGAVKSGVLTAQASTTGWGKTRPVAEATAQKGATSRPAVAPVRYLNSVEKNGANFQALASRCEGLFGWKTDDERVLNNISALTGGNEESLTARLTSPSSNASVLSASVSQVPEETLPSSAQNGGNAATLTAYAPAGSLPQRLALGTSTRREESASAAAREENGVLTPLGELETIARMKGNALTTQETTVAANEQVETEMASVQNEGNASALTTLAPSPTAETTRAASGVSDFAAQLGETNFEWFNSATSSQMLETSTGATNDSEIETNVEETSANNFEDKAVETATTPVDLEAAFANSFPPFIEFDENAEVGEIASTLPSSGLEAPASVAEVGESVEDLPTNVSEFSGTAQDLAPDVAEALDVEAPQVLAAVETANASGRENGVAGPNFALAAPGLGAGEAIQNAADERKDAVVAKPLTGDEIAWVGQIKSAIRTLVAERDAKKAAGEDIRRLDARLRLLYLAVDEYDRSIQEIQDDADPLKVFWENERGDLETLLQSRLEEIDPTFVAERLRAGLDSLSGLCDLQIRKSALVVAPACFGLYEERAEAFKPGETVFAYAELEYVSCRETEDGRLIDVECRWRLLNADGSELTPVETQRCSNLSETKLRDVVLNVSAPLPSDLAPGTYLLETEVVDMNRPSAKPATRRLELTVVAGENAEKEAK